MVIQKKAHYGAPLKHMQGIRTSSRNDKRIHDIVPKADNSRQHSHLLKRHIKVVRTEFAVFPKMIRVCTQASAVPWNNDIRYAAATYPT